MALLPIVLSTSLLLIWSSAANSSSKPAESLEGIFNRTANVTAGDNSRPCARWADYKAAVKSGKISLALPIPELPREFERGCLFSDVGAHTVTFFVLRNGIQPMSSMFAAPERRLHNQIYAVIPPLNFPEKHQDYFPLRVTLDFPGVEGQEFMKKHAWNQPLIRGNQVVFRNWSMTSTQVSTQKLSTLLSVLENQWPSP